MDTKFAGGTILDDHKKPNLQNIPVRTELGKKLRDVFQYKPLLNADYTVAEMCVLRHMPIRKEP